MNPSDLVLVAVDPAPCNTFELIQKKTGCVAFLGKGKLLSDLEKMRYSLNTAKIVLLGMSSSAERSEGERFAGNIASRAGVKIGLFADAPGCHARPWFEEFRDKVSFVSVINEKERRKAVGIFPESCEVAVCGNPDWDKYFFVQTTREDVRARLGIDTSKAMIYLAGHKVTMIALPALALVLQAVRIVNDPTITVVYSAHPGASLPWKEYEGVHYAGVPVKLIVQRPEDELKGSHFERTDLAEEEMIVGSDLVIGECATAEVGAACQRKPTVALMTEITLGRNPEIFGQREWEWTQAGTSIPNHAEPRSLARTIIELLSSPHPAYQKLQEDVFPRPERPGIALENLRALCERHAR